MTSAGPSYDDLLALATRLAHDAAGVLRARPAELDVSAKTTPTDVVTQMDAAAEVTVLRGLRAERPRDEVVAEESGAHPGDTGVTWYVDPLDGTVNYLYGIPRYAVSIGVAVDGEPVAGVVVDVARSVTFAAVRGGGATRDGEPLRVSGCEDLARALVATGFSYSADARAEQAAVLTAVLPRVRDIRRFGSAALDLCDVAAGVVDGYYEAGAHPWDWVAGGLVAEEAGASFGHLDVGPEGITPTVMATTPALYDPLATLVRDAHLSRR